MSVNALQLSLIIAGSVVALGACAPVETAETTAPMASVPKVCRAEAYQAYVGRKRSELPPMPANEFWRVLCSTCAATMDYREDRLTIAYDTASDVIQSARCG